MNEKVNDIVDALLKNNINGSSENCVLSIEYGPTSCGWPSIERVAYSKVDTALIASVADAKAYNSITKFLFDRNHEKNRNARKPSIPNANE
jgi:TRAP-type uncharacterized transport system substrate-binding protein